MGDSGITISTTQGIGAFVFLITTIGTLLKLIRDQYLARVADRDAVIADQKERIRGLEKDVRDQNEILKRSVANGERLAKDSERLTDLLQRTAGVAEEIARKGPGTATRRRGSD